GLRMKAHGHFENRETACLENKDITSKSQIIETYQKRMTVKDSDNGKMMNDKVKQLKRLLSQYIAESHYTF
ncbi:fructose-bisphosphatase class III, partial [Coprobacillus cateniformis]